MYHCTTSEVLRLLIAEIKHYEKQKIFGMARSNVMKQTNKWHVFQFNSGAHPQLQNSDIFKHVKSRHIVNLYTDMRPCCKQTASLCKHMKHYNEMNTQDQYDMQERFEQRIMCHLTRMT